MTNFLVCFTFLAVRCMMYGFGDDQNPYTESVELMEDLVIEYITEMVSRYKNFLFFFLQN